jgi:hypothetical protein
MKRVSDVILMEDDLVPTESARTHQPGKGAEPSIIDMRE